MKIKLQTSIVGTDEGKPFNWSSSQELEVGTDVSASYASRLVKVGQAVEIEEEAKPKRKPRTRKSKSTDGTN